MTHGLKIVFLKCLFIIYRNNIFNNTSIVIKLGLAQRVDPKLGRPGGWTGQSKVKDRHEQKLDKTHQVNW